MHLSLVIIFPVLKNRPHVAQSDPVPLGHQLGDTPQRFEIVVGDKVVAAG
jgi:hypothetical protein